MAATSIQTLIDEVRATNLIEQDPSYWTDAELAVLASNGARDLWRRIVDLYEHHFFTLDETNVTLAANSSVLAGVPTDVYRVVTLEPRVLGPDNPNKGLIFKPCPWQHPKFVVARAKPPVDATNNIIYFTQTGVGGPIGAPTFRIAPQLKAAVNLTLGYNYTLPAITIASNNPIPGESDNALKAWITAYAKSKERDDGSPDPEWLAIYGTEKTNLIAQITPRQIQEALYVDGYLEESEDSGWDG